MSEPDPPGAFFAALDASPGDPVTQLALADWFEEQGLPHAADCLRWLVRAGLRPFQYRRGALKKASADFNDGWFWWALDDPYATLGWDHPAYCRLPHRVWTKLPRTFPYDEAVFKHYPTQRAAYEALLDAWPRVGPLAAADAVGRSGEPSRTA